jgi:hypothetical protein
MEFGGGVHDVVGHAYEIKAFPGCSCIFGDAGCIGGSGSKGFRVSQYGD